MRKKHTFYTLKVWLTTLLVSPVFCFIIAVCVYKPDASALEPTSAIPIYCMIVFASIVISALGWLILWAAQALLSFYIYDTIKLKSALFACVELIIFGNFSIFLLVVDHRYTIDSLVAVIIACYGAVAGFFTWYYELGPRSAPAT